MFKLNFSGPCVNAEIFKPQQNLSLAHYKPYYFPLSLICFYSLSFPCHYTAPVFFQKNKKNVSLTSFRCRLLVRLGHLTYCSKRPILKDCWKLRYLAGQVAPSLKSRVTTNNPIKKFYTNSLKYEQYLSKIPLVLSPSFILKAEEDWGNRESRKFNQYWVDIQTERLISPH